MDLADVDLALRLRAMRRRKASCPFDRFVARAAIELAADFRQPSEHRFVARVAIQQVEAADHFLGFGERSVDQARLAVVHLHPPTPGRRGERIAGSNRPRAFRSAVKSSKRW